MRSLPSLVSIAALTLLAAATGAAAEVVVIHVAPRGDDAGAGSAEQPLATPERALKVAAAKAAQGTTESVEIIVAAGRYELREPLEISVAVTAGKPLTIRAAEGAHVVLSGGRKIGPWRREGDRLVADVPDAAAGKWSFRELFLGGERRPRASTPNEGWFRVEATGPDRRTSFTYAEGDLQPWEGLDQAEILFLHDWSISRIPIQAIDPTTRTITFAAPIGCSARHYAIDHFEKQPRYRIENVPALLDAPGEWFLDAQNGKLSYLPHAGESPESLDAVAPALEKLVTITGAENKLIENVRLQGLTLAHCRWDTPANGYAEGQANFYEPREPGQGGRLMIPAAVTVDYAKGCVVENCRLEQLGGCGLYLRTMCFDCQVRRCAVRHVAGNGVLVGEMFTRTMPADHPLQGKFPNLVSRGNVVADCTIEHCGALYHGAVGVWVAIAADTQIVHNEIRHLPYTGVSVGWSWNVNPTGAAGNLVADNHIHHCMQLLSDGGCIYTLGWQPGTILRGNRLHDIPLNAGRAESNGIFMDEGSKEILVVGNTIYNTERSPIRFHRATGDVIRGNILVHPPNIPPFRYNATEPGSMTYENNVEIEAERWTPPADDPTAKAGERAASG